MFNFFKKKETRPTRTIRDTLFGDMPLDEWATDEDAIAEPWTSFVKARKLLQKGDKSSAAAMLQKITSMPGLESRHYLEAWNALLLLGVKPPADRAKTVYGVVVEVGMKNGADIVAAYADGSARYIHHTGAGTFWERPDSSLDEEINALLKAGQTVANQIGPWDQPRPAAPTEGNVRLNMLTPSGLHFGYGGFETLAKDPMGKAIIDPATQLMLKLTELGKD